MGELLVGLVTSLASAFMGTPANKPVEQPKEPKPEMPRGLPRVAPLSTTSPLGDPGARQLQQDPFVRSAAIDRFRQSVGA